MVFVDVDPEVLEKLECHNQVKECFKEILCELRSLLHEDSRVTALHVENLNDPEGEEIRIYFIVKTNLMSQKPRKRLRNELVNHISRIVLKFLTERGLAEIDFVWLRTIFAVIVKGLET